MNRSAKPARGFTLLEVLVALAILGIAMAAIVQASARYTSDAAYLRDRSFAHWVAMNQVVEARIDRKFPSIGSTSGSTLMGGHEWFWKRSIKATDDKDMRRIEVEVYSSPDSEGTLEKLVAFVGRPRSGKPERAF